MSTQTDTVELTVPEVADELGMTANGVYKLIQRGQLGAVRPAARKTRVPRAVLDSFKAAQQAKVDTFTGRQRTGDIDELRAAFLADAGLTPEAFLDAFKAGRVPDTAETMQTLTHAAALARPGGQPSVAERHASSDAALAPTFTRG